MKNKKIWLGILVLALVFGMAVIGCDSGTNDGTGNGAGNDTDNSKDNGTDNNNTNEPDPDITYTVIADGTADTVTTTQLTFTFNAAVSGLTATDITITAGTGSASKGTLTGSDTSWSLGVTDVAAGTVKVKITKDGIESGEKNVTVNEDKADGSSKEQAITLSITKWKEGSVATGEAKWYKFDAASEAKYNVQWKDEDFSDDYTAWIKVTAYKSDGTTKISGIDGATGWSYPRPVSGVSGTVYLKVEPYNSIASYAGTYAIRFYDPAVVVPQIPLSISSVKATPVPNIIITWSYIYSTGGVTGVNVYRSTSETGTYTKLGTVTGTLTSSYTDTTVTAGNTYWYKVASYNSVGERDKSDAMSDTVPNASSVKSLTVGTTSTALTEDTIGTEVIWYKFTATSGITYNVQWADSWQKPDGSTYTGDILVSAFKSDGTSIFQNYDDGWTSPRTVSSVSGTVYIKVEAYIYNGAAKTGTYGIKVYQ